MRSPAPLSEPAASHTSTPWPWAAWLVLAVSIVVRWIYFGQARALVLFNEATGDSAAYLSLAGGIRTQGIWAPRGEAYFQAPLYPWYLAAVQAIGGGLDQARLFQFAAGAAGSLLAWDTARRLWSPTAGVVAGLLAAVYAPRLFFEGELLSIAWALLFFQAALWLLVIQFQSGRTLPALLAGLCAGVATLAQPNLALVVPAAAFAIHHAGPGEHRAGTPRWRAATLVFLLGAALPILPVLFRNRAESGDWVLVSSNAGINFFIGNNRDADGTFHIPAGEPLLNSTEGLATSAAAVASAALGHAAGPSETSGYWLGRGVAFWTSQPVQALGLTARKTLYFLNAAELPNHYDFQFFRERIPILRILPGFLLLFPLAAWGLLRAARSRRHRLLVITGLAYAASVIFFFVTDRYRLPVIAVLLPAAGMGAADLVDLFRRKVAAEMIPAALVVLLVAFLAGVRLVDTRPGLAHMHNLVGTLHYHRQELGAARQEFERALAIDERSAEAMNNLGRVALLDGKGSEAESWFRRAIAANPRVAEAYFNLEELERNRGRPTEALAALESLESTVAGAGQAWAPAIAYRRGLLHQSRGDTARAREELSRAIRLKPDLAGALGALGTLELAAGNLDAARSLLVEAIRLSPEAYSHHLNLGLVAERSGDYPAALASYREANRLAPDRAQSAYRAAVVLEALGRPGEAVEAYQDALRKVRSASETREIQERLMALEGSFQ